MGESEETSLYSVYFRAIERETKQNKKLAVSNHPKKVQNELK
jgi:hypothetical protein